MAMKGGILVKYLPTVLIFTIIPAAATIAGFLIPELELLKRWLFIFATSFLYFISTTVYFIYKKSEAEKTVEKLKVLNKELSGNIEAYKGFVHKRKIFRAHNLEKVSTIINEYHGYITDNYRGKVHDSMKREFKTIKTEVIKIIDDEKREFDDQLFSVPGDKDN